MTNVATISSASTPDSNLSNNRAFDSDIIILAADQGSGYFLESRTQISTGYNGGWYDIALADLDDDGDLDMVQSGNASTALLRNNGTAHLSLMSYLPVQGVETAVGDFDNDGDLDIYVTAGLNSPEE
ncbi:MAG: FG-GAP-like repeat-containing protein [Planctomycetaceae bacterium]